MNRASLVTACALALLVISGAAASQPIFRMGEELPPMAFKVCSRQADAVEQARLSQLAGAEAWISADRLDQATYPGCRVLEGRVTPRARAGIPSYRAWMPVYAAASAMRLQTELNGRSMEVPYRIALQDVAFYESDMIDLTNRRSLGGWMVEIPDRPYVLDFLRSTGR